MGFGILPNRHWPFLKRTLQLSTNISFVLLQLNEDRENISFTSCLNYHENTGFLTNIPIPTCNSSLVWILKKAFWKKKASVAESVLIQEMSIAEETRTRSDFQLNLEILNDLKDFEELRVKMHFPYTTSWLTLPQETIVRHISKVDENFSSRNPYMIVWVSYEQSYVMNTLDLGKYNKSGNVHFPHQFSHLPHDIRLLRGLCKGPLDARGECDRIRARKEVHYLSNNETIHRCLNDKTIVMIGDSRMDFLQQHFVRWSKIHVQYNGLRFRFGLGYLLHNFGAKCLESQISGKVLIIHSILHDLADFQPGASTGEIRTLFNISECGKCVGTAEGCHCLNKKYAIRQFLENIRRLKDLLSQGPIENVFWVSLNIRPPTAGYITNKGSLHGLHTILFELETYAAREMESIGVKHIDLRPLLLSTPQYWWDDPVHFGKYVVKGNFSAFAHAISVAMFSRICLALSSNGSQLKV